MLDFYDLNLIIKWLNLSLSELRFYMADRKPEPGKIFIKIYFNLRNISLF